MLKLLASSLLNCFIILLVAVEVLKQAKVTVRSTSSKGCSEPGLQINYDSGYAHLAEAFLSK